MSTKDLTDLFTTTSRRNFTNETDSDTEMEVSISKDYVYAIYVQCKFISYTLMLILGIPGHILTFVVFTQTSLSKTSRASLCVALSFVDSGFLLVQYIRMAYHHLHHTDIVNTASIARKFGRFLYLFFTHMDAFIIVLISTERLFAVYKPHRVKKIITPGKVNMTIGLLTLSFLLLDGENILR